MNCLANWLLGRLMKCGTAGRRWAELQITPERCFYEVISKFSAVEDIEITHAQHILSSSCLSFLFKKGLVESSNVKTDSS